MTVTSNIPGFPATYLPQKVVEVSRDILRSFQHSKKVGNYLLGKTIGEGSFAKVKEAMHIPTGEKVAVKVVDKKRVKEDTYVRKNLRREGKILQLIRHPNIVQLYEIMETENSYYLVTELCKGGDLMDYICQRKKLEEREVKRFIRQIISALEYLHRLGILHRDLKVENLLLDENRDIKIIDFGLSNTIKVATSKDTVRAHEFLTTQCGSPAYAAPELLGRKKYGPQVDVWSIGVNMYAMLTGNLPFTVEPFNIKTLYNKMLTGQTNPLPEFVSRECKDLLKRFLTPEPEKRITLLEAMKHQWVAESTCVPMERSPCPNKLRSEDLDENILKHMSETQGFRMSEVIRFVTGNIPSPAVSMYHILHRKLSKYMADMRVKGKVSAMDSQIFGPKKVAVVFQKINANRRNSTGSAIYQTGFLQNQKQQMAFQNKKLTIPQRKQSVNATSQNPNDDVKITDIENEDNVTESTKENSEIESNHQKQGNCKTPVIIRRTKEHTQLPLVTAKVVTKYTQNAAGTGNTKYNDVEDIDSGIELKSEISDISDSKNAMNRRSNYRPHMLSPRRIISRGTTFHIDDTLPVVDKFENKENLTRPVMKRCNTDLSVTARTKPRFQRPCHPETIVHHMCNGQNNDYIRRTEVKVVNNKKLIHLDYSLCNKETKQQISTVHGAATHIRHVEKNKGGPLQCKATTRGNNAFTQGQNTAQNKPCDVTSSERITPISTTSKQVSSKSTVHSDLSSAPKDGTFTVALPSIQSATETS